MRQLLIVALAVACAPSSVAAQTRADTRTEREIRRINSEVAEAGLRGDKATAERLIADDYLYTGMDGSTRTKAQIIRGMQPLPADVKYSSRIEDVVIRDFGGTAVMSYRMVEDVEVKGQRSSTQYRSTDVFMRRRGKWQLIATHSSLIPANNKSR
jgi:ketosteroid isomerase-like protein